MSNIGSKLAEDIVAVLHKVGKIKHSEFINMMTRGRASSTYIRTLVEKLTKEGIITEVKTSKGTFIYLTADKALIYRDFSDDSLKDIVRRSRVADREKRRIQIETTCVNAGISVQSMSFEEFISPVSDQQKRNIENIFQNNKAILFQSDEMYQTIYSKSIDDIGKSKARKGRYFGIIVTTETLYFVYHTGNRQLKMIDEDEIKTQAAVMRALQSSEYIKQNHSYLYNKEPSCIIFGNGNAMIPKIFTGRKWGETSSSTKGKEEIFDKLISAKKLHKLYVKSFFINVDSSSKDLLYNLLFTKQERNRDKEIILKSLGLKVDDEYLPSVGIKEVGGPVYHCIFVPEFNELENMKGAYNGVSVICKRGLQEPISRVLGTSLHDALDIKGNPLPFNRYDDTGLRLNSVNAITKRGSGRTIPIQSKKIKNTKDVDDDWDF